MKKEYEKTIEIISSSLPDIEKKDFIKLIYDDSQRLDPTDLANHIYDNFMKESGFIESSTQIIGYDNNWEEMRSAAKSAIALLQKEVTIVTLEDYLQKGYHLFIDGNGNWYFTVFIDGQIDIVFAEDIDKILSHAINNQSDASHSNTLKNTVEKIEDSGKMDELASFAKKISNSQMSYRYILEFLEDFIRDKL